MTDTNPSSPRGTGAAPPAEITIPFILTNASGDEIHVNAAPRLQAVKEAAAKELSARQEDHLPGQNKNKPIPACLIRLLDIETSEPITKTTPLPENHHMQIVVAGADNFGGGKDYEALVRLPPDDRPGFFYYVEGKIDVTEFLAAVIFDENCPRGSSANPSFNYDRHGVPGINEDHQEQELDFVLHSYLGHASDDQQLDFFLEAFELIFLGKIWNNLEPIINQRVFSTQEPYTREAFDVYAQSFWESFFYIRNLGLSLLVEDLENDLIRGRAAISRIREVLLDTCKEKYREGSPWPCCLDDTVSFDVPEKYEPASIFLIAADLVEWVPTEQWTVDDASILRDVATAAFKQQRLAKDLLLDGEEDAGVVAMCKEHLYSDAQGSILDVVADILFAHVEDEDEEEDATGSSEDDGSSCDEDDSEEEEGEDSGDEVASG
ncbi:unnamed protein product [Amoebophrya sp. A120]|nr:unnamed protein product [Amoebophrya sp. A120]|eukprot:GSA120T00022387001.1